jgi:ABC-type lipoprotein release transport system permease subunit
MTPLLIPLVWYYPQSMVYARRKSDYDTLLVLGRKRKDIRKVFVYESLLAAVLSVAAAVILCPVGMTIFGFAVIAFELPLEFRFSAFEATSMLWGCLATAACAVLTVWLGYFTVTIKSKRRRKGRKE